MVLVELAGPSLCKMQTRIHMALTARSWHGTLPQAVILNSILGSNHFQLEKNIALQTLGIAFEIRIKTGIRPVRQEISMKCSG
jgi:hypothetical protein